MSAELNPLGAQDEPVLYSDRSFGKLKQNIELARRARRIDDHHLAPIHGVREQRATHVLLDARGALVAVRVVGLHVALADEERRLVLGGGRRGQRLVEDHHRRVRLEHGAALRVGALARRGLERKIEHGQRTQHGGERVRRLREARRQERARPLVVCVVAPEAARGYELGPHRRARDLPIVRLGPLFRDIGCAVEPLRLGARAEVALHLGESLREVRAPHDFVRRGHGGAGGHHGAERHDVGIRVLAFDLVAHASTRRLALLGEPLRQQDPLERVELLVARRRSPAGQVGAQQPRVEERLLLLVREVRPDHAIEECAVFVPQEQMQLMTPMAFEEVPLLAIVQSIPADHGLEPTQP